ncbi:MAG TPA: YbjN domain-containing protein [Candidatus Limnocylindrales bacterium]|nr:YbjN domain-containing protein [Candidatus Limnocylindrales bacterium]
MTAVLEVIRNEELSGPRLLEIFRDAYIEGELDSDGDVRLTLDGIKVLVTTDVSRKLLHFITIFGVRPGATRQQVLELCNRVNDRLILIRAAYPSALPSPAVMLDHYVVTEAGVTADEIVDDVRRFRTVIGSVPPLNTDDILN